VKKKLAIILATIAIMSALAACGGKNDKEGAAPSESLVASQEVVIKASSWDFDKPEYEIPKNTPVKLTLENLDGAHGIEIKGAKVRLRNNQSEVISLEPGTYEIICNVMCGKGHNTMKSKLVVK